MTVLGRRDLSNSIEGVVRVYNTGQVNVVQRYLAAYAVNLDMRNFPFDTQVSMYTSVVQARARACGDLSSR